MLGQIVDMDQDGADIVAAMLVHDLVVDLVDAVETRLRLVDESPVLVGAVGAP
jgi:hypothetical protein